jgi:hypothetical protein
MAVFSPLNAGFDKLENGLFPRQNSRAHQIFCNTMVKTTDFSAACSHALSKCRHFRRLNDDVLHRADFARQNNVVFIG